MNTLPNSVKLSTDVLFQDLNEEAVLLNLKTEHYYSLDSTGKRFWQLFAENDNPGIVMEKLLDEYLIDREQLQSDMIAFLDTLSTAGLLSID